MLQTTSAIIVMLFVGAVFSKDEISSEGCPSYVHNCICTSGMYDCSDTGRHIMLSKTEKDIRTLDMSGNNINRTMVLEAPSLIYLSLANNKLKTLQHDTFDNLSELKTLVLSNNSLSRMTDDIFEWNPLKLEVLKLDGNKIEFIQHFLFYDLEQLTELDMHNNKITFIHPHAFLQLKKLTKLRLDGNHLHTFESKWFRGLEANMFSLIDMSANPWACDCTMKEKVGWLTSKNGKWVSKAMPSKLKCVRPASMANTPVTQIVGNYNLECSAPDITGISEPTTLYVNQSIQLDCVVDKTTLPVPSVMWIAPNKDQYNLQTADRFEGIEVFQNGSIIIHMVNMDDGGEYTCVATNNVSSVQACTKLVVKERLKNHPAEKNDHSIQTSDTEEAKDTAVIFDKKSCPQKCTCVSQHVDCSSEDPENGLTEINYSLISNNTVTLDFSSNSIIRVPAAPENMFKFLTEFRLDNNNISIIEAHAFDHLPQLQTLTMRDNRISKLPGKLFRRLSKLTILVLDNNFLTHIDDHTFFGLSSLQWIYIRNNLINSITEDAFAFVPDVRFIHMEHNQLSTLSTETVKSLTEPKLTLVTSWSFAAILVILHFIGARDDSTIFHQKNQHKLTNIQHIFVDDNLFNCDCHLQGLKDYLKANPQWDSLFGDGIRCSFPPTLYHEYLQDISQKLACGENASDSILAISGSDGGRECHFPFEFNNQQYSTCILVKDDPAMPDVPWCATTANFTKDRLWGFCPKSETPHVVTVQKKANPGTLSGLWLGCLIFGGLIFGLILSAVIFFLWRKNTHQVGMRSMKHRYLPGYAEKEALVTGNSVGEVLA